jgi:DNA-binding IclR family transcriptional regulator
MPAEQLQTLTRAIAVLDCFSMERGELGVREVARMLNLSSSAAGRMLVALKELGVLSQNPETRAYSMGPRVLSWAGIYNSSMDIRNRAIKAIEELHESTRQTISLYILEGDERVCIERLESQEGVRIVSRIGRRLPLYAGSAGKAMLAFLPREKQEKILFAAPLSPLTSKTITDPAQVQREIELVRERGCAVSFGEWIEDAAGVAAPIFNRAGEVIAALSISGPIQRFSQENVETYCVEVRRVAENISASLGNAEQTQDTGMPNASRSA